VPRRPDDGLQQARRDRADVAHVLLPTEWDREDEYLRLFDEVLASIGGSDTSGMVRIIAARAVSSTIWAFNRESQSKITLLELRKESSTRSQERRGLFRDADERVRLRGLYLEDMRQALELVGLLGEAPARVAEAPKLVQMPARRA
jgi:hypothetical protein